MAKSTRDEALFPNGLRNWAWTIAPAWKSIAFAERLYAHRIFTSLGGPGVVRRTELCGEPRRSRLLPLVSPSPSRTEPWNLSGLHRCKCR